MNHKHIHLGQENSAAFLPQRASGLVALLPWMAVCLSCAILARANAAEEKKVPESQQRLSSTVEYLSADEREGRGVGTKGLDMAADFIAKEFSRLGLNTELYGGQPFQEFSLVTKSEMGKAAENHLQFNSTGDKKA